MPKPIFLVAGSNPSRTDDGQQESIGVASASTTPPFPPFDHHMGNIDDSGPGSSLLYMNFDLNPVSTEHSGSTAVSTSSILLPDLGSANTTFSSSAVVRESNLQKSKSLYNQTIMAADTESSGTYYSSLTAIYNDHGSSFSAPSTGSEASGKSQETPLLYPVTGFPKYAAPKKKPSVAKSTAHHKSKASKSGKKPKKEELRICNSCQYTGSSSSTKNQWYKDNSQKISGESLLLHGHHVPSPAPAHLSSTSAPVATANAYLCNTCYSRNIRHMKQKKQKMLTESTQIPSSAANAASDQQQQTQPTTASKESSMMVVGRSISPNLSPTARLL